MKKSRSIVIALILLAILIGVYSYITLNPKQPEDEITTTQQKIELSKLDADTIVKLELLSDKRNLTIKKENTIWIMNENKDITASQNLISTMVNSLSNITVDTVVEENAADLSIYGLDKPNKAIVTLSDGNSYTFLMGNTVPTGDGNYFMKDGEKNVYILTGYSYKNAFNYTFEELVQKEQIPNIEIDKLKYVYIAQKNKPELEITALGENELDKYEMWNSLVAWKMTKPYIDPRGLTTNDAWSNLVSSMEGFDTSVRSFVANNPENLNLYGLDEPQLELWFKDSEGVETHLYFGNEAEDGTIYFKQANSKDVYTMGKTAVDTFMNLNTFDIVDKFCMIFMIEDINKVSINKDNKTTNFDVINTKEKDEDGAETTITTCKVDGTEYPEEDFKKLYQNFIGIMLDSEYKGEKLEGNPDVTITFEMSDGNVMQSKYYKYDDNYYVFDKNGVQEFLINKRQIDNLSQRMTDFFNGTISE